MTLLLIHPSSFRLHPFLLDVIDAARRRAERRAFEGLLDEFAATWADVVAEYAGQPDEPEVSKLGDAR